MPISHTFRRVWARAGEVLSSEKEISAGAEYNVSEEIPPQSNNLKVDCGLDVSEVKALYILSDRDLTIKTNSATSPANTFLLTGGHAYLWLLGDAPMRDTSGNAVTTDVTALYVTNVSDTDAAMLNIRALVDPTV